MNKRISVTLLGFMLLAVIAAGCGTKGAPAASQGEDNYIPVEIETAAPRTVANVVTLSGKVLADKDVMIFPKIPGKVAAVPVKVGDAVSQGATLVTLDDKDIVRQVEQAQVALKMAESNYELTRSRIENAKTNLARVKELFAAGAVSQSDLEQAELAASDAPLAAVEAQLVQSRVAAQQAADALADMSISSPISGVVSQLNAEVGEMVANTQPVAVVVNTAKVLVAIDVSEDIVNSLRPGQAVPVTVAAADTGELTGIIHTVSPAADQRTQLYAVKVAVDNPDGSIKPGMFARVQLQTAVRENALAVKNEAVVLKNGQQVVYVVVGDKAVEKAVELSMDDGTYVEVVKGLNPGEKVVVKGQDYVTSGTNVKVVGGK